MRARLYVCDICGELEDKYHGGAFYIFRYKQKLSGFSWHERHKMVMCHSCFCKMLEFCGGNEKIDWEDNEAKNEA